MWYFPSPFAPKQRTDLARWRGRRPRLETLEDRWCPAGGTFEWADPTGGALDPTFGSGGQVVTSFSNHYDAANAIIMQSDGKILIAGGSIRSGSKTGLDFLVARYNADGSVDTSFGSGGYTVTDFKTGYDSANAVAIQPQGAGPSKILAAGSATVANKGVTALARYNANGSLDTTFGSKGKVTIDTGGIRRMVVDGAGRILGMAGTTLTRYTANGALDTTFGSGGKVVTNIKENGYPSSFALQADGKIIVAATSPDPVTGTDEFVVARYTANGAIDATFGTGGIVTTHPPTGHPCFSGLAIQADGKVVLAGFEGGVDPDGVDRQGEYILRYNTNGSLDGAFGSGGITYLVNPGMWADSPGGVAIQSDGWIVAGGVFGDASYFNHFTVVRVSPSGILDPGYGTGGWASVTFGYGTDAHVMVLQPDGRVLLAGYARPNGTTYPTDVAVARFLASAPQIGSFTAGPSPVVSGGTTTLTASNFTDANPGATVALVDFYIMVGGSPLLLGRGTRNSDGSWSFVFDTTGYAPGTYTLYAQATDNYGALGNPVSLTLTLF
ncbi:MAG: hypothetical protein U0797_04090 [Gemmataceae bacterium]